MKAGRLARWAGEHAALVVVLVAYAALALPLIEADLPTWDRMKYQTVDEMYYALAAHEWATLPWRQYESIPFNLLQNVWVGIATSLAGWSYATLRMGSFACGAAGLVLVHVAWRRAFADALGDAPVLRQVLFAATGLALVAATGFHYASIVLEPSISVALYTAAVVAVLSARAPNPWAVGAVVASGPVVFYPYTLPYLAGAGAVLLVFRWKQGQPRVLKMIGGALALLALLLAAFYLAYPLDAGEFGRTTSSAGRSRIIDVRGYPIVYLLQEYLGDIPRLNLFRFSPLFLPVVCAAVLAILLQAASRRRLPPLPVCAALAMVLARLAVLFFEKTHFERKTTDLAFLLMFLVLAGGVVVFREARQFLEARTRGSAARLVPAALCALPLLALAGSNGVHLGPELRSPSFHNRDTLAQLGQRLAHCTAVGEWGIGLAVYGPIATRVNTYRYTTATPEALAEYSREVRKALERDDAVVVGVEPPSGMLAADLRASLVPVYRFRFIDGGAAPSPYAVYLPASAMTGTARSRCHAGLLAGP